MKSKSDYYVVCETPTKRYGVYMIIPNQPTRQEHKKLVQELEELLKCDNVIITGMTKLSEVK